MSQIRRPLLSTLCPYCGGSLVEPKELPRHSKEQLRELKRAELEAVKRAKEEARIAAQVAREQAEIDRAAKRAAKEAERAERQAAEVPWKAALRDQRQQERQDEWACSTKSELIELAKKRGYAYPHGYADRRWPFIESKQASRSRHLASHPV
ncbi:hypothetical protein [Aquincola sp. J276]|uniref:hypothetical protein n=1 Tax=Aquincola sp. J276 TaxID=2898432 RepID=UPI00215078EA|nr:hypothetical protein [Aquincola sp. J276]MCR5865680.1 hypothetical protein [Aquincola sp. J276]